LRLFWKEKMSEERLYVKIEGFVRPLNLIELKSKTEEFGTIQLFWMNKIRSFAILLVKNFFLTDFKIEFLSFMKKKMLKIVFNSLMEIHIKKIVERF
jgi:hypothetical protein